MKRKLYRFRLIKNKPHIVNLKYGLNSHYFVYNQTNLYIKVKSNLLIIFFSKWMIQIIVLIVRKFIPYFN